MQTPSGEPAPTGCPWTSPCTPSPNCTSGGCTLTSRGAAYFVVCEALTNVVKHSATDAAGIHLSASDGKLVVLVHDNGVGLADADTDGHGLTNLRDRVEALGGRLLVDGTPGGGTSVIKALGAERPARVHNGVRRLG